MRARETPVIAQVELTNHCPYTCIGCPRTYEMTRPLGFMSRATFEAVIAAIEPVQRGWRPLSLHHMGESLLHPEIAEFIEHATSRGVPTSLACRPNHLTPARSRALLEAGLAGLVVSVDALDTPTLQEISGKVANYEGAKANIDALLALKRELQAPTHVIVQMIAYARNKHQWERFIQEWRTVDEGVQVALKRFSSWTLPQLAKHAGQGNALIGGVCNIPFNTFSVLWDGRVVLCNRDHDGKQVFGNVADGIDAVWHGEAYRQFREAFLEDALPADAMCRGCIKYPWREGPDWSPESNQVWFAGEGIEWSYSPQRWLEKFGDRVRVPT